MSELDELEVMIQSEIEDRPMDDWDDGFNGGIRCALSRLRQLKAALALRKPEKKT